MTTDGQREPLLSVRNLRIGFGSAEVVHGISFDVAAGRCLGIVGESGSGKTQTAKALLGLTGPGSWVRADRLAFGGADLRDNRERDWRRVRGREIGFVLQDALVSLDRLRPIGQEVAEPLRLHRWGDRARRSTRVLELLEQVGMPEPASRARQRPAELSGGQRQRALIASALAMDPALLVADEPTTALDVTVQARILELLAQTTRRGKALIVISHDLAVVSQLADEIAVVRSGVIVEHGPAERVLTAAAHEYTRALLAAVPSARSRGSLLAPARATARYLVDARHRGAVTRLRAGVGGAGVGGAGVGGAGVGGAGVGGAGVGAVAEPGARRAEPILRAEHLVKRFARPDGSARTVVNDVSFDVHAGEILGVVGESGSGKTTTARIALALTAPDEGDVWLHGRPWSALTERQRRPLRRRISTIYQDPLGSFDPRWSVRRILADSLATGPHQRAGDRLDRVVELLELVGLDASHLERRPLRLSGGQRQRVAIARALAPEPELIVCDEPVSALDVSIQAQVLDLLGTLRDQLGVGYLFISHDLGVIHHLSDRVLVMKDGRIVEHGSAEDVFDSPSEPYTRRLLESVPTLGAGRQLAGRSYAPA